MSNTFAIFRRDFGAYFTTPVGYIFMMVFVTISVGLYITSFFTFPIADMRPYFENLPLMLCVFIPAVTMRVWAEERKENTWEMLLTFPMKSWELVIGKFLAAVAFFALALLATFTIPAMLFNLGNPDTGAIISGYFGTLLIGAFFLSLGILFSGFFKDQIVAFIVSLLACFGLFLVGFSFIAGKIDERVPGFGSLLSDLLGFFDHYTAFTRGVIEFADVVYFVAWTIIFLVLNIMYIDGRNRPGAKTMYAAVVAMCVVSGMAFNWLIQGQSLLRIDMTEDKIYTVSEASREILEKLDAPANIKIYITPKNEMPTELRSLQQDVVDKIEELRLAASGNLEYDIIPLNVANIISSQPQLGEEPEEKEVTEESAIEERMLEKGVQPFTVQAMSQDQVTSKLIYSSIGVGYKDRPEEILPQILPQNLQELEYRLVSTIYKLSREEKPIVALIAPKEAVNIDPQMRQILQQMGQPIPESDDPYVYLEQILDMEKYEVHRVELSKDDPLPEEYDTLAVINPRGLSERQQWEIGRALHAGKSVIIAAQQYQWDYRPTQTGLSVSKREETPNINPLLENYGLGVSKNVLMDANKVPLRMQTGGIQDMFGGGMTVDMPTHILLTSDSMSPDVSITSRLANIFYLWGTALEMDEAKLKELGLKSNVIMHSTSRAWEVPVGQNISNDDVEGNIPESQRSQFPLMAIVEGQFPDAFAGKDRPAWPKPQPAPGQPPQPDVPDDEPPAAALSPQPGKLILLGCSQMFRKEFLQQGNLDLFLNSVDSVTLDENLVHVRGRKPIDRSIDRPTDSQKTFWTLVNYTLANLIIASVGIGFAIARHRSRNAYTVQHLYDADY